MQLVRSTVLDIYSVMFTEALEQPSLWVLSYNFLFRCNDLEAQFPHIDSLCSSLLYLRCIGVLSSLLEMVFLYTDWSDGDEVCDRENRWFGCFG